MPSKIFKDLVFCFAGNFPGKSHEQLTQLAVEHGATVANGVSQRVTHLIALEEDIKRTPLPSKIEKAMEGEIPIISIEFIEDSIAKGKLLEEEDYSLRPDDYKNDDMSEEDELFREDSDDNKKTPKAEQTEPTTKKRKATDSTKKATRPKKPKKQAVDIPEDFVRKTGDIAISIKAQTGESISLQAQPKKFRTGSLGWSFAGQKMKLMVGDQELTANVTGNFVIRGSKTVEEEEKEVEKNNDTDVNNNVTNGNANPTPEAPAPPANTTPAVQFSPVTAPPAQEGWFKCIIQ